MFIRTGVQKCQPFPTHSTAIPLNSKQTQATLTNRRPVPTRTGVHELRGPALICSSSIDKKSALHFLNSVLASLVGQNPKCSGYNQILFISKISDVTEEKTKEAS